MNDPIRLLVPESAAGQRLDHYLTAHIPQWTRSALKRQLQEGHILVNGRTVKAGYRIETGDRIDFQPPEPPPSTLEPEDLPVELLYEDECLAVVNKPAGLVVHPGAGNWTGTLANALLFHFEQFEPQGGLRPGIVHRLDKETSGLLVVAKTEAALQELSRQFKERTVEKTYQALVHGVVEPDERTIDLPIGRHPRDRIRMSTKTRTPRSALTRISVLKRYPALTHLKVRLETGRTHQIRVHMQAIGHPVVGDQLYGGKRDHTVRDPQLREKIGSLGRHFLHAWTITFHHPTQRRQMSFESPLPEELTDFLRILD